MIDPMKPSGGKVKDVVGLHFVLEHGRAKLEKEKKKNKERSKIATCFQSVK